MFYEKSDSFSEYIKSRNLAFVFSILFILILSILAYFPSLFNGFLLNWDDGVFIIDNPWVKNLNTNTLYEIFFTSIAEHYHPLTHTLNAIEYYIFGPNPFPFHIVNLYVHLVNVILVYKLFLLINKNIITSSLAACIFAVHPMHVESVAWLSELKDLLYTCFFLTALICYIIYIRKSELKYFWISLVLFLFSLLSKSAGMVLSPLLIIIDIYCNRNLNKKVILEKVPFFVFSIVFGLLAVYTQKLHGAIIEITIYSLVERIFILMYSFTFYIEKFFLPFNLSAFHPYPLKEGSALPLKFYIYPVILIAGLLFLYKIKKIRRVLIFGLLFYTISISIVLQLIPVGQTMVSERFSYVSYLGLIFIFVQISDYLNTKIKRYYYMVLGVCLMLFSYLTFQRTKVWKDGFVLFENASQKYPKSHYIYWNMGTAMYLNNEYEKAIKYYNDCIKLKPEFEDAYIKLGLINYDRGDYHSSVNFNKQAIKFNNRNPVAYNNCGFSQLATSDSISALNNYSKAIQLDSTYILALVNRANLNYDLRNYKDAITDYNRLLKLHPNDPDVYARRAMAKAAIGDLENALTDFDKSIQIQNVFAEVYTLRAEVHFRMNEFDKAISDCSQAIYLNNNYAKAYLIRGDAKHKTGSFNSACADWKKALGLKVFDASERLQLYCR